MKKTFFLVSLLLCQTILGASRPGHTGSSGPIPADLLAELEKEGWEQIQPGVMQRELGDNKVESLGFGPAGLAFKIKEMRTRLAFLRKAYTRHPSPDLARAIRAHRAEILRTQEALKEARAAGKLESSSDALVADGPSCSANYDATVLAQPGSARADSYFDNLCGYIGEVYAHASATATSADDVVSSSVKSDPAANTPRIGTNVTASAAVSANGVKNCSSYAYASVTSYDLAITYSQSANNSECVQRQVTIANPPAGSLQISPVRVVASASSPHPVTMLQIYLDGSKAYEVNSAQLATDVLMAPGSRRLTVQAYDASGTFKTTQYIDVCALSSVSPSVTICAPTDGATVSSPVRVLAGTTSVRPVRLVQVYLDGNKVYEEYNTRLDQRLAMSPGTHRLTVQAYDDLGSTFKSTIYVTVQ